MIAAGFARTTLRQPWLTFARIAWFLLAVALLAGFFLTQDFRTAEVSQLPEEEIRVLAQYGLTPQHHARFYLFLEHVVEIVFVTVAFGLVWRKSDDWLVMAVSLYLLTAISGGATSSIPMIYALMQLTTTISLIGQNLPFVFPDGRFVPRWTIYVAVFWSLWAVLRAIFPIFDPYTWPAPGIGQGGAGLLAILTEIPFLGLLIYAQIYRYRYVSTPVQRQQTKWVLYGIILIVLGELSFLPESLFPVLGQPGLPHMIYRAIRMMILVTTRMAIPITLAISILRYRLWDIDIVINRSLVYAALTVSVIGVYVLIVGSLGRVLQTSLANPVVPFAATGVVAIIFQPMRDWFQRGVNRLMYGERDDPYAVLTRLGHRLEATLAPEAVFATIVQTVAEALKLPYAAVRLANDHGERKIEVAFPENTQSPPDGLIELPLTYQGEIIGQLQLAPRAPGEGFSPADQSLLEDFARQAGIAAHAIRLTLDLQRARERIVTAREEERRRMRRDLHDGLGAQLAALNLQVGAIQKTVAQNPETARAMLQELRAEIKSSITNIRRVVYDLRPPALDELGLLSTLRDQVTHFANCDVHFKTELPDSLPTLPAAVEVAVYRIAQEALTNVARHAQARNCMLRLTLGNELKLEIEDDGAGLSPNRQPGVGLRSMRERAEELGGRCEIDSAPGRGTRVTAYLPMSNITAQGW
jgi:signal transduction histidine kinase